jgi:hypothetical protein
MRDEPLAPTLLRGPLPTCDDPSLIEAAALTA